MLSICLWFHVSVSNANQNEEPFVLLVSWLPEVGYSLLGVPSDGAQLLLVATCHIHWDPECCDVKLIQTMMLMNKLKSIMEETQQQQTALKHQRMNISSAAAASPLDCNSIPLILCGDLNSLPDSGNSSFTFQMNSTGFALLY